MPVPENDRRRQIAEAVWRLAARGGMEQLTLRQVAAEAGVPPRLLQYHFGTRQQLLLGALEILNADTEALAQGRIRALGADPEPREVIRAILHELLPLDDERHARHLVYGAYFLRFVNDPELRGGSVHEDDIARLLVSLLEQALPSDGSPRRSRHDLSGTALVALAEGLQAEMLLGHATAEQAIAVLDHQLGLIFD